MLLKIKKKFYIMLLGFAMRKYKGMHICTKEYMQEFATQIEYRTQLALYELHTEANADMSWDKFVARVQHSPTIRKKAQRVAMSAIIHFDRTLLDFDISPDALREMENDIEEPLIRIAEIFTERQARAVITNLFLLFELEHFHRLARVIHNYSWQAYCADLTNDKELWNKLTRGLQYGIWQIDFKATWITNTTQGEILQLEFYEEKD